MTDQKVSKVFWFFMLMVMGGIQGQFLTVTRLDSKNGCLAACCLILTALKITEVRVRVRVKSRKLLASKYPA